jgi:hypothetical protein
MLRDFFVRVIDVFGKDVFMLVFRKTRAKKVVYARFLVAHYLRTELRYKHWQIAEYLNQPRQTITTYLTKYYSWYEYNKEFRNLADKVLKDE